MDASRLLEVLTDIALEFPQYLKSLQALNALYAQARDTPTKDFSSLITPAHSALLTDLEASIFENYPPSKQHILEAIGGAALVGKRALNGLNDRLLNVGVTGAAVAATVNDFVAEVTRFHGACAIAEAGLIGLNIVRHELSEGEYEIGLLIPRSITDGTLGGLGQQLSRWNKILKAFSEAAGEDAREISVEGLATGSDQAYLTVGILTAGLISHAIDKILEWYKKILDIQEARQKLASLGAPVPEVAAVKAHEKQLLDGAIEGIVREVMEQSSRKIQADRKNEIEIQLKVSVSQIATFIDRGGDVEVTGGPPPEVPEEPADETPSGDESPVDPKLNEARKRLLAEADKVEDIRRKGASLRLLAPRQHPILQLNDAEELDVEEASNSTTSKPKKK